MKISNKARLMSFLSLVLALLGFSACRDKLTLDQAGDEVYITISPAAPDLKVYAQGEPVSLVAKVTNYDGQAITDAEVKWSSDNPEVAAFKDGDNKIYGINSGLNGRNVRIRATLKNGKYAVTEVFVAPYPAEKLELLKLPVLPKLEPSKDKKGKELLDESGKPIMEWSKPSYESILSGQVELIPATQEDFIDVMLKPTPENLFDQGDLIIDGANSELLRVEPLELDSEVDAARLSATPKGAKWYRIHATGLRGSTSLKFSANVYNVDKDKQATDEDRKSAADNARVHAVEVDLNLEFGTKILDFDIIDRSKLGIPKEEYTFETVVKKDKILSVGVDYGQEDEIEVRLRIKPDAQVDVDAVLKELSWGITNVRGGGGIITKKLVPSVHNGVVVSRIQVQAGQSKGSFTAEATVRDLKVSKTYGVIDVKNISVEDISTTPNVLDIFVGEDNGKFELNIKPLEAFSFLAKEIRFEIEDESVAKFINEEGKYSIKGLKSGKTRLKITLRDKEFYLPITTRPKVHLVEIDNTFGEVIVMNGDTFSWRAKVSMQGNDNPDWSLFHWLRPQGATSLIPVGNEFGEVVVYRTNLKNSKVREEVNIGSRYGDINGLFRKVTIVPKEEDTTLDNNLVDINKSFLTGIKGRSQEVEAGINLKTESSTGLRTIKVYIKKTDGSRFRFSPGRFVAGNDYSIQVEWAHSDYIVRKVVELGSSVEIISDGEAYTLVSDLRIKVGDQILTIDGRLSGMK